MMLTAKDWEQVNEALKMMDAGFDERKTRQSIMDAIYSLIYYDFGDFCYASYDGLVSSIMDPVVKTRYPKAFQQEYEQTYQREYSQMDYTKWCLGSWESLAFRESDIIDNAVRLKTRFFTEFLQPRGLVHSMGCYIIVSDQNAAPGAIALYRDSGREDFSEKELQILQVLLPHMEKCMSLCAAFQRCAGQTADSVDSADLWLMNDYGLTRRELSVVKELRKGQSNREIAAGLNISVYTVKKHISNILGKTDTANRVKLLQLIASR